MNKPRSERRRPWRCLNCHMRMHQALGNRIHAKMQREAPHRNVKTVHVCGNCKTMHCAEGGKLRLLTTGERFEYELHCPEEIALIEATQFNKMPFPGVTLIVKDYET